MSKNIDPNLKNRFDNELKGVLQKTLNLENIMQVPSPVKIIVNIGIPKTETSTKDVEVAKAEMRQITGQEPKIALAKQSIAGFKIRAGDAVGVTVTLRGQRMFDFLDKLCRIVLPQVKDFRGVKRRAFDGNGNYTLGLSEQIIFPEIDYAKVDKIRGLEITIVTSASSDEAGYELLKLLGMPFEKEEDK